MVWFGLFWVFFFSIRFLYCNVYLKSDMPNLPLFLLFVRDPLYSLFQGALSRILGLFFVRVSFLFRYDNRENFHFIAQ